MGREKIEVVPSSCYLGDYLSCELDAIIRGHVAWGQFDELLPILTSRSFPITPDEQPTSPCKQNLGPKFILHNLQRNDRAKWWSDLSGLYSKHK